MPTDTHHPPPDTPDPRRAETGAIIVQDINQAPKATIELPIIKTTATAGTSHKTAIDAVAFAIARAFANSDAGSEHDVTDIVKYRRDETRPCPEGIGQRPAAQNSAARSMTA